MARSPRSKSITDNTDATDLFFHGFLLRVVRFYAPVGRYDYHGLSLAGNLIDVIAINFYKQQNNQATKPRNNYPALIGANTIRRKIQDQVNPRKKIREKDKIRRIGAIRELF